MKWTSYPALKCRLITWSDPYEAKSTPMRKKGMSKKKFKIHCFRGKHRRIHPRKSIRGNPTAEIRSRESDRGNPFAEIHPRKSGESGKLKKRGSTQIQTGSKACSTTGNFAAKVVLLASVESCRNQFRRLFWIWSAKRERAWTNELFSRIWAISNASRSTELLHSKKWFNLVNNRNSSRAAKFKGQSKILCHSESR